MSTRDTFTTQDLIDDAVSAAVAVTGYPVAHVRAFIEPTVLYLLREYGGERLPKAPRVYPVAEILASLEAGTPRRDICRRFRVSMGTLYRLEQQARAPLELAGSR